ncbi:four helix bundle protein [Candidatus Beckwithbacteria bacterium]|nr:four helix bundle protein [Candidatus Beckwithbacteria bacterium]
MQTKRYDLEERTFLFAKDIRDFLKKLKKDIINLEDIKQLLRSSGSIGANYIEANEAFSKKDFIHRIKISRKEAKETIFWLNLLDCKEDCLKERKEQLVKEATELMMIFGSIIRKTEL